MARAQESELDQLAAIRRPTLVIAADQDSSRSQDEARELLDGIQGASLHIIEGSEHMIPIEKPAELEAILVPWLRENVSRS